MITVERVVALDPVADDLAFGKDFYDQLESGVGDYFWDSLMADIRSLKIYAGVHVQEQGLYRMPAKRFPYQTVLHHRQPYGLCCCHPAHA